MRNAVCLAAALFAVLAASPASAAKRSRVHNLPRSQGAQGQASPSLQAASLPLVYYGGAVVSNPRVYVIWWGDPANISTNVTKATGGIEDFYRGVLDSIYVDGMAQYQTTVNANGGTNNGQAGTGQLLGRGNYAGTYTLDEPSTGTFTDTQVQEALEAAVTAGTLPAATANTIYAIYFPSAVTVEFSSAQSDKSCFGFGGYHDETVSQKLVYIVIPDCGDGASGFQYVSAHELGEAMTDRKPTPGSNPDYPQAWNDSQGYEIADKCDSASTASVATATGTFSVEKLYDNRGTTSTCATASHAATDFNVQFVPNALSMTAGSTQTVTVKTTTWSGSAQALTLSKSAPAGVHTTLATTASSGDSLTMTITTDANAAVSDGQVIVNAFNTANLGHTAALLIQVTSAADGGSADAGTGDAGTADAGTDGGTVLDGGSDGGAIDGGGAPDAGSVDGGAAPDAGSTDGGGAPDAGSTDGGGAPDAGSTDGGGGPDAGSTDGGGSTGDAGVDAGPPPPADGGSDAGTHDGGSGDAGNHPGTDAGTTDAGDGTTVSTGGCGTTGSTGLMLPLAPAVLMMLRKRRQAIAE